MRLKTKMLLFLVPAIIIILACISIYNQLNAREQADFAADMEKLTDDSLSRVADELEWFTLKFDYRNADKPWGNSRDALERAVTKLRGWCVGAEPGAKK